MAEFTSGLTCHDGLQRPCPCPLCGVGPGGPGTQLAPAGTFPLPSSAQNTAPPSCDPSLLPPQSHSHPLCQGEPGPGRWNPNLPRLALNGRRRGMSHGRLCPCSHPQLTQKVLPKAPRDIWCTHLLALTHLRPHGCTQGAQTPTITDTHFA